MRTRAVAVFFSFACVMTCSQAVRADDATDQARTHFSEGVTRFEAGDYEGARSLFLRADKEHHAPVIIYNVARSEERLDHPQAAVDAYDAYLREAGDSGEFATAAALAMAQIRARSPRLRVETTPPGANVFVDGQAAPEKSPTSMLVTIGQHHIVAEGDGWHSDAEVDATDPTQGATVLLVRAGGDPASVLPAPFAANPTHFAPPAETIPISGPHGSIFGGSFSIVAYHFFSKRGQADTTTGVAPALIADVGYAITPRTEILLRVLGGLGSEGTPVTLVEGLGPGFSFRALPALWIGAWCLGGRIESSYTPGEPIPGEPPGIKYFETGWVFAPQLDVSFSLLTTEYGQWMLSVSPSYYFASPQDNGALFIPMSFGLRTF